MLWGGRRGHGNFVAASNTDFRKFLDRNVSFTSAPRHFDNRRQLAAYAVYVAGTKGSNPPSSSGESGANLIFGAKSHRWPSKAWIKVTAAPQTLAQPGAAFAPRPLGRARALGVRRHMASDLHPAAMRIEPLRVAARQDGERGARVVLEIDGLAGVLGRVPVGRDEIGDEDIADL
ncbi:MAG TPA: hypothetical protein VNW89_08635 [Stellaceae bacterium]|nr:hypothetical protein [Stellaceae bacterium]